MCRHQAPSQEEASHQLEELQLAAKVRCWQLGAAAWLACKGWRASPACRGSVQGCTGQRGLPAQVNSRRAAAAEADVERLQRQLDEAEKRAESLAWQVAYRPAHAPAAADVPCCS